MNDREPSAAQSFGELAIQKGWASRDQVEHCLETLRGAQGTKPRLGQLMVQMGILTKEQVRDLLTMQSKELFLCSTCTKRYNVVFWNTGKTVTCPTCRTALIRLTHLKGIVADETILCEE
jgi:ribosomal protein S27E